MDIGNYRITFLRTIDWGVLLTVSVIGSFVGGFVFIIFGALINSGVVAIIGAVLLGIMVLIIAGCLLWYLGTQCVKLWKSTFRIERINIDDSPYKIQD